MMRMMAALAAEEEGIDEEVGAGGLEEKCAKSRCVQYES